VNVVQFLLGDSPASEFYVKAFCSFLISRGGVTCEDGTTRMFRTVGTKIQTPGNNPKKKEHNKTEENYE
jgi:hypothetical protein